VIVASIIVRPAIQFKNGSREDSDRGRKARFTVEHTQFGTGNSQTQQHSYCWPSRSRVIIALATLLSGDILTMIDVNDLRRGVSFDLDGDLFRVLEYSHNKPGRGNATIRVQVRNLRSGATREMTFTSGERVQDIRLETRTVEYLYADDQFLTFMDIETYDQPQVNKEVFGDDVLYLKENLQIKLSSYNGEMIDYELPTTVEHEIVESEMAVAGDNVSGASKQVRTETGLKVSVPLFVNVGDTVRIDTRTRQYVTRV
jgi:elongation factor P